MHRYISLLALLFYLSVSGADPGALLNGREILNHCVIAGQLAPMPWGVKVTTGDASAIACRAFLGAVNDTHNFHVSSTRFTPRYCLPPKVTMDGFAAMLVQRSLAAPPSADVSAGKYILGAYAAEFPCTEATTAGENAIIMTGKTLLEACRPVENLPVDIHDITTHGERNLCLGYLAGAIDSHVELQSEKAWCPADNSNDFGFLVNRVTNYLQTHNETHSDNASAAIRAALIENYPCK